MSSKTRFRGTLAFSASILALVGCAVGTSDTEIMEGTLTTTPIEAGTEEDESSVVLPPPSQTEKDEDAGAADASSDAGSKADGGDGGTTTTGVPCTASNTCAAATDLGAVSGDTGGAVLTAQGTGSQWFRVYVTEDDDGVAGVKLRASATLTSPAGTNFDLYLYNGSSSSHECSAVSAQSTNGSGMDQASVSFGEGGVLANGSNDSRYVTVEVRHVSGTCSSNAKWSLSFNGNN